MAIECLQELCKLVYPEQIRQGQAIDSSYQKDWSSTPATCPLAVIFPHSTEQLAAIVKVCAKFSQPIIPQGGRTGLTGAATPYSDSICISLEKLNSIVEVDTKANSITVGAGVLLQQVQEAAQQHERYYPVDFGARGSCQIGGVLATNAGGNNVIRYGMARETVLGLEVVTAQGDILDLNNKMIKNNAGYDLKQLFIGSEGTLGFITQATLKLASVPGEARTALCAMSNYQNGVDLLRQLQSHLGQSIHAFEMMWLDFYSMSCDWSCSSNPPVDLDYPLYVLIECRDCSEDAFNAALESAFESELIQDAAIAASLKDREKLWAIREATTEFPIKLAPINFDISLPIGDIDRFVQECTAKIKSRWPNAVVVNFGHIGDSNLHLTIDKNSAEGIDELEADKLVYQCVEQYQGSISAEHGIGTLKRDFLHHSVSQQSIELMRTIKQALDPKNILNPGKLIPK
ncbi:FAD-binding oxidoreductase [Vibrio sp. TH_r3]|uniref:FAD-binding oxidoreductase n=1 Tax=Vibrio sp. TH_r3 TaxID=3082084 RepID=UPI002954BBAA|nr:FAD-binding oxidoreductase [Vibrio sp. TH_r3]MDV7105615.1 FAD-binding oxidoreductase [Vibrio sp. TH_r3]